jgi:hypothetical protein
MKISKGILKLLMVILFWILLLIPRLITKFLGVLAICLKIIINTLNFFIEQVAKEVS